MRNPSASCEQSSYHTGWHLPYQGWRAWVLRLLLPVLLSLGVPGLDWAFAGGTSTAADPYLVATYRITDPMVGTALTDLNTAFWEPSIGPPGNAGPSEQGYVSISNEGLVLGSFNVALGQVFDGVPKWVLEGDFRVSFFLETSPNPGDYGNRLGAYIYEMAPLCGAFVYPSGYAGLWMGYSAPEASLYYPLQYNDAAYFLFVKVGSTVTIYKGDATGVTEDPAHLVFFGDYLNPAGQFLFGLGTGNPNSGWMRVRDVVINTHGLLACDGITPIPPEWEIPDTKADQAITFGPAPTLSVGGTVTVTATGGSSGNPVTFSSQTPGVCTSGDTHGSLITGLAAGTCTVAANQAGNEDYNPAPEVTQSFPVADCRPCLPSRGGWRSIIK